MRTVHLWITPLLLSKQAHTLDIFPTGILLQPLVYAPCTMREKEHLPSCAAQWLQMLFPADSWHTYPCRSIFNPYHLLPCFSNFLPVSTLQICHPLLIYLMNLPLHYAITGTITCCNTYITVYSVHASWFIWLLPMNGLLGTRIISSLDCPPYISGIILLQQPSG